LMRHCVLRVAVAAFLMAVSLQAQAPHHRAASPVHSAPVSDDQISVLALPAAATHVISILRCTLVDTRNPSGPFGGPRLTPGVSRSFVVPNGPCSGIAVALGYALTFTGITPDASTVHLKAWPTGTPAPTTPTLTLSKGTASVANNTAAQGAAIEASSSGSI